MLQSMFLDPKRKPNDSREQNGRIPPITDNTPAKLFTKLPQAIRYGRIAKKYNTTVDDSEETQQSEIR